MMVSVECVSSIQSSLTDLSIRIRVGTWKPFDELVYPFRHLHLLHHHHHPFLTAFEAQHAFRSPKLLCEEPK